MLSLETFKWISIAIAFLCVAIVLFLKYLARNDDYWKKRGIPYAPRMNVFSLAKIFREKPIHVLLMDNAKKYGKIFGTFEASQPGLVVADPELLRDIMVKDFHLFPLRRAFHMGDPYTDKMLVFLTGDDWKRVRTVITPAFTSRRMRQMSSIISDCSKSVVEVLKKHAETGEPIDCKGLLGAFSMDVIASAAFGTKIESYNDPNNEFVLHAKKTFVEINLWMIIVSALLPMSFLRYLGASFFAANEFFLSATKTVIQKRKEKGERHNDVLQILMNAADEQSTAKNAEFNVDEEDHFGSIINTESLPQLKYKTISDVELFAQCALFFPVGYETSASLLTFLAYALASNPEWQEKLISEVDEAFQKHTEMSYDSVKDMKLLDAAVMETLRLYPALLSTDRTAVEDYKLGDTGIIVEKGTVINIPIYAIHHDPDFFEDPEKFDPTRFMDNKSKHHPYAYLPFGAGPRNCLGMRLALLEVKLCITNILRHYRLRLHSTTKSPLEFRKGIGFMSVKELPLAVEKRTDVQS